MIVNMTNLGRKYSLEQERMPKPGQIYRHFKNKLYQIITVAAHSESGEKLVIYQALYGNFKTYARPLAMFVSEVDKLKYPEIAQKYRFELINLAEEETQTIPNYNADDNYNDKNKTDNKSKDELNNTIFNYSIDYSLDPKDINLDQKEEAFDAQIEYSNKAKNESKDSKEISREPDNSKLINEITPADSDEISAEDLIRIEEETGVVNPILMEFLEADSYQEKLSILLHRKKNIDDKVLNDMAVSMDCTLDNGDFEDRFQGFLFCMQTYVRFEDKRLR
jgi:hypothetical protein